MFSSFILIVKKKTIVKLQNTHIMIRRSSLEGAISFKWTYHGGVAKL